MATSFAQEPPLSTAYIDIAANIWASYICIRQGLGDISVYWFCRGEVSIPLSGISVGTSMYVHTCALFSPCILYDDRYIDWTTVNKQNTVPPPFLADWNGHYQKRCHLPVFVEMTYALCCMRQLYQWTQLVRNFVIIVLAKGSVDLQIFRNQWPQVLICHHKY
jgi:hypothetical protein